MKTATAPQVPAAAPTCSAPRRQVALSPLPEIECLPIPPGPDAPEYCLRILGRDLWFYADGMLAVGDAPGTPGNDAFLDSLIRHEMVKTQRPQPAQVAA